MILVRSELLGHFLNTLTSDYKYSRQNLENLWKQVPRQIYRKTQTFSSFFVAFLKSTLNFEYFEKKDQSHSLSINEIINCETGNYLNVQNAIIYATLRKITC